MIQVAAGILFRNGCVLACRRKGGAAFELKWEFPGGKLREGECAESALARELGEELGIRVQTADLKRLEVLRHRYLEGLEVELHFFQVLNFTGEPANLAFAEMSWVPLREVAAYDFLEADRPLVARIAAGGIVSTG